LTGDIVWRAAIRKDRGPLMAFTCADEPTRSIHTRFKPVHEKPWAYEAQSMARDLRPPVKPPHFVTVGVDREGIVAVAEYQDQSDDQVHIDLVAVAKRAHRQGIAARLAEVVAADIIDRFTQLGRDCLIVTAYVHPENQESRAFCERAEFEITGRNAAGYDIWGIEYYPFLV
jgi:RimJ/RimL family protein N-acetyltransferase